MAPTEVVVAYIALVVRFTQDWFTETQKLRYGKYELVWHLNLGIPAASYDLTPRKETYEHVARAAWWVAHRAEPLITLTAVKNALERVRNLPAQDDPDHEDIAVIPEVAAQVVGYARSPLRNPGLHLMVDVGAGTVDACAFILHEQGGSDEYPLLQCAVELLGSSILHRHRVRALADAVAHSAGKAWDASDPGQPVPAELAGYGSYLPGKDELLGNAAEVDRRFLDDCLKCLSAVLIPLKRRRDPRSERWRSRLPIFLCGGGSRLPIYRRLIAELEFWLTRHFAPAGGLSLIELPKPDTLEAQIAVDEYHRLSVAWGLSHPDIDIGPIIPGRQIEDIPPSKPRDLADRFVSKEQV